MSRVAALLAVFGLAVVVRFALPPQVGDSGSAAMALGFVLLVSYFLGGAVTRFGLPAVTGYLLVGMVFGPYLLGRLHPSMAVLGRDAVSALRLLDALALGLIALSAGGELKLAAVRRQLSSIAAVIAGQVGLVFIGVTAVVLIFSPLFPSLGSFTGERVAAAAMLLGVIATANSPATVLAIVQEVRSRGPLTDLTLAVTVAKDVVVISLFSVALAFAIMLARPDAGFDARFLLGLGWEIGGSIAAGVLLGWLVVLYLEHVEHETPLLVLGVAFVSVTLLPALHLSGLLCCMVAGFFIENFSRHGDALIEAIERHSLPVYVVFFTIAGAGLNLDALRETLPLALTLAGMRLVLTAVGTAAGMRFTGCDSALVRYGWSGFVAQAGVTLGFAVLIERRFPEIGDVVKTVVLATIALNQLMGPVLFRVGLYLAGEIPRGTDSAQRENSGAAVRLEHTAQDTPPEERLP